MNNLPFKSCVYTLLMSVSCAGARAEQFTNQLAKITESFVQAINYIHDAPPADREKLYDELAETVSAHVFVLVSEPDGRDALKRERDDAKFAEFVCNLYAADQNHLKRSIIHTDAKEEVAKAMLRRATQLVALFPLSQAEVQESGCGRSEMCSFILYLGRAYPLIPTQLQELVREQMPRWRGEDRLPGLLVLVEGGDEQAKSELSSFTSDVAKKQMSLFRHIVDHETKQLTKYQSRRSGDPHKTSK